jgi:hypothetical protein
VELTDLFVPTSSKYLLFNKTSSSEVNLRYPKEKDCLRFVMSLLLFLSFSFSTVAFVSGLLDASPGRPAQRSDRGYSQI